MFNELLKCRLEHIVPNLYWGLLIFSLCHDRSYQFISPFIVQYFITLQAFNFEHRGLAYIHFPAGQTYFGKERKLPIFLSRRQQVRGVRRIFLQKGITPCIRYVPSTDCHAVTFFSDVHNFNKGKGRFVRTPRTLRPPPSPSCVHTEARNDCKGDTQKTRSTCRIKLKPFFGDSLLLI